MNIVRTEGTLKILLSKTNVRTHGPSSIEKYSNANGKHAILTWGKIIIKPVEILFSWFGLLKEDSPRTKIFRLHVVCHLLFLQPIHFTGTFVQAYEFRQLILNTIELNWTMHQQKVTVLSFQKLPAKWKLMLLKVGSFKKKIESLVVK